MNLSESVLAANPSFSHEIERQFWTNFEGAAVLSGWGFYINSARKIDIGPNGIVIPARLNEVARFLPDLPRRYATQLPAWLSEGEFRLIVDWEHRRWRLPNTDGGVADGLHKLAYYVDSLFKSVRPSLCLTTNKIDHGCFLFWRASRHFDADYLFVERSPLDSILIEPRGMFAESEIWARYPDRDQSRDGHFARLGEQARNAIRANPEGFRPQISHSEETIAQLRALKRPLVFLPMDNSLWTGWAQPGHPQGDIDYPSDFRDPSAAVEFLASEVARLGGTLIVRKHPSDLEDYLVSRDIDNIVYMKGDLATILTEADVTVCFLTKVAFTAAAFGAKLIVIGPNTIAASRGVTHVNTKAEFQAALQHSIFSNGSVVDTGRFELFLGWLQDSFYYSHVQQVGTDRRSPLRLFTDYRDDGEPSGSARIDATTARKGWKRMTELQSDGLWLDKTRYDGVVDLIFDVSRFANERLYHSGISRFIREALRAFSRSDGIRVHCVTSFIGNISEQQLLSAKSLLQEEFDLVLSSGSEIETLLGQSEAVLYFSPYEPFTRWSWKIGVPRVTVIHDLFHITRPDLYGTKPTNTHIKRLLSSLQPEDFVITVSEYTRRQALQFVPTPADHVRTCYLAASPVFRPRSREDIDAVRQKHGISGDFFVVFAQSDARKNVAAVLESVSELHSVGALRGWTVAVIRADLASDAVEQTLLAHLAADVPRVLIGSPNDDELACILSGAEFCLFPSLAEGFGLPVLEAMSCGCPTVTSSTTSLPEVAGDSAQYVDPTNASQIRSAIQRMLNSADLRAQLGERALSQARHFSWEKTFASMEDFFREILADTQRVSPEDGSLKPTGAPLPVAGVSQSPYQTIGGQLKAVGKRIRFQGEYHEEWVFRDDTSVSVHGACKTFLVPTNVKKLRSDTVIRCSGTVVMLRARAIGAKGVADIVVDLNNCFVYSTRVSADFAWDRSDLEVTYLNGGWFHISASLLVMSGDERERRCRVVVGSADSVSKNSKYKGTNSHTFSIAKLGLSVPSETPLGASTSGSDEDI